MNVVVREFLALFGFKVDTKSANEVEQQVQQLKQSVQNVLQLLVAGALSKKLMDVVTATAMMGDELGNLSEKLGITTNDLQKLNYAANLADVGVENFQTSLRIMARTAAEAAKGGQGEAAESFAKLGVKVTDANGQLRPMQELLLDVADAMSKNHNATEKVAQAQRIFGRSGSDMVLLLNRGRDGIQALTQEAEKYGGILDEDLIRLSSDWDDSNKRLKFTLQGFANTLSKEVLPFITQGKDAMREWLLANKEWLNHSIVRGVKDVLHALVSFKQAAADIADVFVNWVRNAPAVQNAFLGIAVAAGILAVILESPVATMLLLLALVGLLIDDFETWRHGGKSVLGDLIKAWNMLDDTIRNALGLPGKVIAEVLDEIVGAFRLTQNLLLTLYEFIWNLFTKGFKEAFKILAGELKQEWDDLIDYLLARWKFFTDTLLEPINFSFGGPSVPEGTQVLSPDVVQKIRASIQPGGAASPSVAVHAPQINTQVDVQMNGSGGDRRSASETAIDIANMVEQANAKALRNAADAFKGGSP